MSIDFSCNSCSQRYRVKDAFSGKTTRCKKCGAAMTVPTPAAELPEVADDLSSLLDAELGAPKAQPPASSTPCPNCRAPLPQAAILCVQCGYDLAEGKRRVTVRPDAAPKKRASSSSAEGLFGPSLPRGILFSGVGAALGALLWALVAVFTGFQSGWIAWGLGAAAGGGMSIGHDDNGDGTVPGIIAAFMSLGGIVLAKILIIVFLVYPLVMAELEDLGGKREILASQMAEDALVKQGIDPDNASDAQFEKEYDVALQSLQEVSDEEIDRRYEKMIDELNRQAEEAVAEAQQDLPEKPAQAAEGQENLVAEQPQIAEAPAEDAGDDVSLVGLFFSTMFGPIDGLFILLAFFSAYKLGSGAITD